MKITTFVNSTVFGNKTHVEGKRRDRDPFTFTALIMKQQSQQESSPFLGKCCFSKDAIY